MKSVEFTKAESRANFAPRSRPRWTRAALPRQLQIRITHGIADDSDTVWVDRFNIKRAGQVISSGLVSFHDDDWWSQSSDQLADAVAAYATSVGRRLAPEGEDPASRMGF